MGEVDDGRAWKRLSRPVNAGWTVVLGLYGAALQVSTTAARASVLSARRLGRMIYFQVI